MADAMGHVASGVSSSASLPGGLLGVLAAISLGIARPLGISPQAVSSTLAYVGRHQFCARRLELESREIRAWRNRKERGRELIRARAFCSQDFKKLVRLINQPASPPLSRCAHDTPVSSPPSTTVSQHLPGQRDRFGLPCGGALAVWR